jgi:hypothetical protein
MLVCDDCGLRSHPRCGPVGGGRRAAGEPRYCRSCVELHPEQVPPVVAHGPAPSRPGTPAAAVSLGSEVSTSSARNKGGSKRRKKFSFTETSVRPEESSLLSVGVAAATGLQSGEIHRELHTPAAAEAAAGVGVGVGVSEEKAAEEPELAHYFEGEPEQLMDITTILGILAQLPEKPLSRREAHIISAYRSWASINELRKVVEFLKTMKRLRVGESELSNMDIETQGNIAKCGDGVSVVSVEGESSHPMVIVDTDKNASSSSSSSSSGAGCDKIVVDGVIENKDGIGVGAMELDIVDQ